MKKLFLMAIVATTLFACAKGDNNQPDVGESAYISLKLSTLATKADLNKEDAGTPEESKMVTATVLLFNEHQICLGSVEFTSGEIFNTKPATIAKPVDAKTKQIFVVVNKNNKWDLSKDNVKGKSWSDINSYVEVMASDISTNDSFVMTNTGDPVKGALSDANIFDTPEQAKQNPSEILVDRVSSKVIVKTKTGGIGVSPAGAKFTFGSWELNTTNKKTSLYSEYVSYTSSAAAKSGVYRKDNNYYRADFNTPDQITYMNANYNWLKNGTDAATMSPISRLDGAVAYCTENTMEADAQRWGHTTKVVVKGTYTPAGLTEGASFFSWRGNYYSVAQLKQEYIKTDKAALKTDLVTFLTAAFPAGTTYGDLPDSDKQLKANIDAALDGTVAPDALDEYSGIKAKYNAVRYYHNAVNYYDALINHDHSNTALMSLARYGVVRNNAYELTINNVAGPGTPWIPDPTDPTDPTDPNDPDDEVEANLSIDVKVKSWTYWIQGVDLGK